MAFKNLEILALYLSPPPPLLQCIDLLYDYIFSLLSLLKKRGL
jgi:hypothetical protein